MAKKRISLLGLSVALLAIIALAVWWSAEPAVKPATATTSQTKGSPAHRHSHAHSLTDADPRERNTISPVQSQLREASAAKLRAEIPGVEIEFDEITGGPKSIMATGRFLTPASPGAVYEPVSRFVETYKDLFGHGPAALAVGNSRISREDITTHNGMKTVVWQQELDGIPFFQTILRANLTRNGELITLGGNYLADAAAATHLEPEKRAALIANPPVPATRALVLAAANLNATVDEKAVKITDGPQGAERKQDFKAPSISDARSSLAWVPLAHDSARLAWDVTLTSNALGEMFRLLVDVENGEILVRQSLTNYISDATYRVFANAANKQPYDSPTPMSPGHPTPLTTQPAAVSRELVTIDALNTTASPNGWINDGGTETLGNNVDAHADSDGSPNSPDLPRPTSATRNFDFPIDFASVPGAYKNAAITQLFYLNNWVHDKLYELGFTESAGNFQTNNFSRGGLGNDAVLADAQDGSGTNNANFSTPADGSPGRMQMYIFTGPTPDIDGDLDTEIVIHEYVHGLSNRLVGGGVGMSASQSRGMGEGWSDFYGMALLSEAGDDINASYAAGGYATRAFSGLTQNYYYGIRRYPYSTNLLKNPLTFKDIDPSQASDHSGIPRSSIIGSDAAEVHNQGEVWCVALWEVRANLIARHGFAVGNPLTLQLVTDGMKLSPANPNFIQARNAIIQADLVNNGGTNRNELWAAFSKRGMGASASSPASSTAIGLVEAFDFPDDLGIAPLGTFEASGQVGGAISPASRVFTLHNGGTGPLNWAATKTHQWLTISPASGSLAPGGTTTVTATFTPAAAFLSAGSYADTISFTNSTSGAVLSRPVSLAVEPLYTTVFADNFESGTISSPWTITGTAAHRTLVTSANAPHAGTYHLTMDSSVTGGYSRNEATLTLNLAGLSRLKLSFWAKMFNDEDHAPTTNPFTTGANFDGLAVSNDGGNVWYEIRELRSLTNSWEKISVDLDAALASHGLTYTSNFKIRFNHYDNYPITTDGFSFDDVLLAEVYDNSLALAMPDSVTEGDASPTVTLSSMPVQASAFSVSLASNSPEATVPPTITVPAGAASVTFPVTLTDDSLLDGSQTAVITASAPTFANVSRAIVVHDNETAALAVDLPDSVIEGSSPPTGLVTVSAPVGRDVAVTLTSENPSLLVPATATLPAGATSAQFTIVLVNDSQINGSRAATIRATVTGWVEGTDTMTILDDETTQLTLTIPVLREGDTGKSGTVSIPGTLAADLTVTLVSSDATALTTPASVTIAAGKTSASIPLTVVDDAIADGGQPVTLDATAAGFTAASASGVVEDNDAHHFSVAPINGPVLRNAAVPVTVTAKDINDVTITNYSQTLIFSAIDGSAGVIPVTPSSFGTFNNGVLTANLTFGSHATGAVLTATDSGGHVGSSNAFDIVTGPLDHFVWGAIPALQSVDTPIQTTLRAVDTANNPVTTFTGQATISAAVSERVEILTWTAYADTSVTGEYLLTKQAISRFFTHFNETTTTATDPATLAGLLVGKNVFLIVEQESGNSTTLGSLGTAWTAVLTNFVNNGGIVIACSYVNHEHLLLSNSGLLDVTTSSSYTSVSLTKDGDTPLNANVAVPFTGSSIHAYTTTNSTVDLKASTGEAVVISRTLGSGRVVLIGTDFYTVGTDMDRVIANAASLAASPPFTLSLSPAVTGSFTAGEWSGPVSVPVVSSSVKLRATAAGGATGDSNPFSVSAATSGPQLPGGLTLTIPNQVSEGAGVINGSVTVAVPPSGEDPLVVTLTSKSPTKISVPLTVEIPARGNSAVVPLTLLDDPFVDGAKEVIITAMAAGYQEIQATIQVTDNDSGTLGLSVPSPVLENGGNITGNVTLSIPALTQRTVTLASDLPFAAQVPATLVIPRGVTSVPFTINIPDDGIVDGEQAVQLSATLAGWSSGTADLLVQDNENRDLVVSIPALFREPDAPKTGTVSINGAAAADVIISLSSSNSAEISVAPTITIAAGQSSASFFLTAHDDTIADGEQPFTITASAPTFTSGHAGGVVRDNEAHHFTFAPFGGTQLKNGPVPAVITARDALGAVVTDFNQTVTLSAGSDSGPLEVSPAASGVFINGRWSGSVQINALATNVVLTANDGFGHTGSSNPFDLIDGAIDRFEWSTIPSPQSLDTPFTTTLRAVDAAGATVTGYNGIADLFVLSSIQNPMIGTGNTSLIFGLYTGTHDYRSNSLYTAAELGGAARITSIAFNVTTAPSAAETLTNWTIRLKHSSLASLANSWDNSGWTTVYHANPVISATGWVTFNFTTPFDFDGTRNLLVDCSMDRTSSASRSTYVQGSSTAQVMTIYGTSNSGNGDPLTWTGTTPYPNEYYQRANVRFGTAKELAIRPAQTGAFANGTWTGEVSVPVTQTGAKLRARAGATSGTSNAFDVLAPATPSDGGATVLEEDFESGSLNPARWTSTGTGNFRTQVTSSFSPHGGTRHMAMDTTSGAARNEATLTVDLAGRANVVLKFWAAGYGDEPDGPPTSPFTGGANFDGVAISADGTTWWEVQGLRSLPSAYGQFSVDLDAAIATHGISYNSNFKIRFNQYDNLSLTSDGIVIDDIVITANPLSGFVLSVPSQVGEADGTANGSVILDAPSATDTVVALTSAAPAKITVPSSATVPAGQTSAPFALTIHDDTIADGSREVALIGTVAGKPPRKTLVTVLDDDSLPFTLAAPGTVAEGAGAQTGTITLGAAPAGIITANLVSSDASELTVPLSVIFQPGQTVATFPINVINDTEIDGTQLPTITAEIPGWGTTSAAVSVTDNENRNLSLSAINSAYEGNSGVGTIYLSGTLAWPLTVTLVSSDPAQYAVPASVTIAAGELSANFIGTAVDDTETDGIRSIQITATAASFTTANVTTYAYDNDIHHFGFSTIPTIQKTGIPFSVTVSAQDINNSIVSPFAGTMMLTASGDHGPNALTPFVSLTLSSGSWTGNVTCANDDTTVRITATGSGKSGVSGAFEVQRSPAISLNPSAISLTLNQGQSATRNLAIQNTGGGTLSWSMTTAVTVAETNSTAGPSALATLTLEAALSNLNANSSLVRAAIPGRYAFSEGVTGDNISDGGNDMYDGGNYLNPGVGSTLAYSDNLITNNTLLGTGGRYFTRKYDGLWVFAADLAGRSYFEINGNLGADGGGSTDSTILSTVRDGVTYRGFVKRVYATSDPSVNHLIIMADNTAASQTAATDTNDDAHRVSGITAVTRLYHVLYAGTDGTYIDNAATLNIMNVFLDAISAPDWITPTPAAGSVAAGASQNVTLNINTAGLAPGTYQRTLVVTSNDPVRPSASLPVTLTISSGANLAVSPATGLAASGSRGGPFSPASQAFTLSNSGGIPLAWTAAKTSAWLDLSAASGTLAAGASVTVTATLNPTAAGLPSGTHNDSVVFTNATNGAGNTTRPVTLTANPVGQLEVGSPGEWVVTGPFGGPFTPAGRTYNLANTGDAPIQWTVANDPSWLSLSSASGTLAAGASTTVTATISANTTEPGNHSGLITFTNATNDRGTASRPVSLSIALPAPTLAVEPAITGGTTNTLSWDAVPGAGEYEVEVATDASFSNVVGSGWIAATSHTFTGLSDATLYHFRIRARRNSLGTLGSWSQTSQADFAGNASSNASASASPGSVVLTPTPGGVLTENFDGPGTAWSDTIFPNVSAGTFTRQLLTTGPNTTPPLPVNQSNDQVARLLGTRPSALLADVADNRFADGSIEAWIAPAHQTNLHYAGMLLRATRSGTSLNGYAALLVFYGDGTVKADFTRIIAGGDNGLPNWFYSNTTNFALAANENIHARFSIAGSVLTLRLWRVSVVGGIVTETPIPFYQGGNTLTATDATYTGAGLAGLYDSYSDVNQSYFDDVTVSGPVVAGGYVPSGTLTSPAIAPSPRQKWGTLAFTKDTSAAGTNLAIDVLDPTGGLLAANVASGTDLDTLFAVATQPSIRLRANLSTSNTSNTPRLDDWTVGWQATTDTYTHSAWSPVASSMQDSTPPAVTLTGSLATVTPFVYLAGTASDSSGVGSVTTHNLPAATQDGYLHWTGSTRFLTPGWTSVDVVAADTAVPPNIQTLTRLVFRTFAGADSDFDGMTDIWEVNHGLDPFDAAGAAGAHGDLDNDGLANLLELAFGLDPRVADVTGCPRITTEINAADGLPYLVIRYRRLLDTGTLTYFVEVSADCQTWSQETEHLEQIGSATPTGDDLTETVAVRVKPAIGTQPGRYVRVKVTSN